MKMTVALLIWGQACFVLGVTGNVFVLYATIVHDAIKLDTMSMWIIKNLAVVDVCNCIFVMIPEIMVQYGKGRWALGADLCYSYAVTQYTFVIANVVLINFFSFNKLLRCLYPLRNLNPTRLQRMMVPVLTSLVCSIPIVWVIIGIVEDFTMIPFLHDGDDGVLKARTNACSAMPAPLKTQNWVIQFMRILVPTLCNGMFCLTLVITTTALLVFAVRKTKRPINKKNISLVILVTFTFLIAFLPYFTVILLLVLIPKINDGRSDKLYSGAWFITFLSSWTNPVIYVAVNRSFREFTIKRICACTTRSRDNSIPPLSHRNLNTQRLRRSIANLLIPRRKQRISNRSADRPSYDDFRHGES